MDSDRTTTSTITFITITVYVMTLFVIPYYFASLGYLSMAELEPSSSSSSYNIGCGWSSSSSTSCCSFFSPPGREKLGGGGEPEIVVGVSEMDVIVVAIVGVVGVKLKV